MKEHFKLYKLHICNFIIEYTFETKSHTQLKTTSSARLLWTTVKIQFNTQTPYKEFEKKISIYKPQVEKEQKIDAFVT